MMVYLNMGKRPSFIGIIILICCVFLSGCTQSSSQQSEIHPIEQTTIIGTKTVQSNTISVNNVVITYNATELQNYHQSSIEEYKANSGYKFVLFNFYIDQPESIEAFGFNKTILHTRGNVMYQAKQGFFYSVHPHSSEPGVYIVNYTGGCGLLYEIPENQSPYKVTSVIWFRGNSNLEEVIFPLSF